VLSLGASWPGSSRHVLPRPKLAPADGGSTSGGARKKIQSICNGKVPPNYNTRPCASSGNAASARTMGNNGNNNGEQCADQSEQSDIRARARARARAAVTHMQTPGYRQRVREPACTPIKSGQA